MKGLWYLSGLYVWVYQGCFWHCIRHDKCRLSWQAFDIYRGYASGKVWLPSSVNINFWKSFSFQGCFWHCIRHDKCRLSWQAIDFYRGYVSGEARLQSSGGEYKLLNTLEFIKAVSDTVLATRNTMTSLWYLPGSTSIISKHKFLNMFQLSRLFLTLYLIW